MFDLTRFKNIHSGEMCVIIGNGPSLNQTPLDALGGKYVTFGSNKIYRLPFTPTYYSIIDKEMLASCLPLPVDFHPKEKFMRAEARDETNNPIYPIVVSGFSLDINNFVVMGGTVTFALLQIAFYMGFKTCLLVGVDHHYPNTGKFTGHKIKAGSDDPDHFQCADGKPYFETGKEYNAPELEGTAQAYDIARELFKKADRQILNLTPNTRLEVFDKDKWSNWL